MWLGCEWRHARKWWAGNFGDFWKKQLAEIWRWTRLVEIRTWARPVQLWSTGCAASLLGQWIEILTLGREFSWTKKVVSVSCISGFPASEYVTYIYIERERDRERKKKRERGILMAEQSMSWQPKGLIELFVLNSNTWNHLTVCQQMINIE